MPQAPRIVPLDEIESIPGPGSLVWKPVRYTLDVRAFGCNAYTAGEVGQDIVEPHTEDAAQSEGAEKGHQELYFVAAGRVRFTIDGADHDVAAGTYVFVPDPASRRQAVATEVPATVLTFGGPASFAPSDWEWTFRATPLLRSDPDQAAEILAEGLQAYPESASLHYNLACLHAVQGRREQALSSLRRAIEIFPKVAEWAREDEDFQGLKDDPGLRGLLDSPGEAETRNPEGDALQ
jgi:tetratricopeptide (TPR) repeat protein